MAERLLKPIVKEIGEFIWHIIAFGAFFRKKR